MYIARYSIVSADQELKEVSLHHLIRKKGEKNAEEITAFDRMFKAKKYAPDPVNVKKYVHLIRESSIEMIRKYNVILCTTAVGSNPKVLEAASVFQVNVCVLIQQIHVISKIKMYVSSYYLNLQMKYSSF